MLRSVKQFLSNVYGWWRRWLVSDMPEFLGVEVEERRGFEVVLRKVDV